jgi:flagellar biosynthesis protein
MGSQFNMMNSPKELRTAVALAYSAGGSAPKVVATGKGVIADRIIEMAQQSGVFVHESPELVALLMDVDLDQRIPPNLYRVVAELMAWLYRIEAALPPKDLVKK